MFRPGFWLFGVGERILRAGRILRSTGVRSSRFRAEIGQGRARGFAARPTGDLKGSTVPIELIEVEIVVALDGLAGSTADVDHLLVAVLEDRLG